MTETEITILMPCLNEAESLPFCIGEAQRFLAQSGLRGEVLIADNGSTDDSCRIALEMGARVVHVAERGYGSAIMGGVRAANGRFIVMGDSDGSYDFANLSPFVQKLGEGYALVMGDRFAGGIKKGAMPASHRLLGVPLLSWLGRRVYRVDVRDFHCGLRAFDRRQALALDMPWTGMEFATGMIGAFARSGARIGQLPTPLGRSLRKGPGHLRTLRDGWRHLRLMLGDALRGKI